MKISEKCKHDVENLIKVRDKLRNDGFSSPYNVVMWGRDFESISELYLAYKDAISEKIAIQADFEESEDRCATLEAENKELKEQVIDGLNKERRSLHNTVNILRQENNELKEQIEHFYVEAENKELKDEIKKLCEKLSELHTIKKSFEVLRALYLGDYEDEPFWFSIRWHTKRT